MEYSILQRDLSRAIVAREYLIEVKQENTLWQEMLRRMHKHRATQQSARYAFGMEFHTSFNTSKPSGDASSNNISSKSHKIESNSRVQTLKSLLNKEATILVKK